MLLKNNWKLHEIDMCDIRFLMELSEDPNVPSTATYADEVPWL